MDCPCGSGREFAGCCEPVITGARTALTAEALMRARYTAYTQAAVDFLMASVHPDRRTDHDEDNVRDWAQKSQWLGLEILATEAGAEGDETGTVEFVCSYIYGDAPRPRRHHELAEFARSEGQWFFVNGGPVKGQPVVRESPRIGRNDACPCGSGKKYKKCCG